LKDVLRRWKGQSADHPPPHTTHWQWTIAENYFHSGMRIFWPHIRIVCVIDTVAMELQFVSKQDVTMQPAIASEPVANFSLWAKSPARRCCTRCK
jgi:hypothetical protein